MTHWRMPRLKAGGGSGRGGNAFARLRLDETLAAKYALIAEHDPSGANDSRLEALNDAINETLSDDDVFCDYFEYFIQGYIENRFSNDIWALFEPILAARDIALDRRNGNCLGWKSRGNLMLEGIDYSALPRLRAVWGAGLWLNAAFSSENFAFRLWQMPLRAGWDRARMLAPGVDRRGEALWAGGRFGSADEFATINLERKWRMRAGNRDNTGGAAARSISKTRELLSEIINLALLGGGAWPGLVAIADDPDRSGAVGIVVDNDKMRLAIDLALGEDVWGDIEPGDICVIGNWRIRQYFMDRGVTAFAPREWAAIGWPDDKCLAFSRRRFMMGVGALPELWIRREGDDFVSGVSTEIGFCEMSGLDGE